MSQWSPSLRDCQTVRSLYCINYYLCSAINYYLCSVRIAYVPMFRKRTAAHRKLPSRNLSTPIRIYVCALIHRLGRRRRCGTRRARRRAGPTQRRPTRSSPHTPEPKTPAHPHRCCGLARHQVPVAGALAARDRAAGGNGGARSAKPRPSRRAIRCGDSPWPLAGQNGQNGFCVAAAQASMRAACHPRHVSKGNAAIQLQFLRTHKRARDFV